MTNFFAVLIEFLTKKQVKYKETIIKLMIQKNIGGYSPFELSILNSFYEFSIYLK